MDNEYWLLINRIITTKKQTETINAEVNIAWNNTIMILY